ncbi:MAG TPA: exo-alpha-sialidase [Clostridiaceae bacterium]|nr:exo-alpha-sialidase [Clostridiaceae bacterium]
MLEEINYLCGESDIFVGKRRRLKRYLVCSMQGYFPVLIKTGSNSLAVIFRTGAPHVGIKGTLAVSTSDDGGKSWSDPVEISPRGEDVRNPAFGINDNGEFIAAFCKLKSFRYEKTIDGYYYNSSLKYEPDESSRIFFTSTSKDNGKTWSPPVSHKSRYLTMPSPYGRIARSSDGTLYMTLYGKPIELSEIEPAENIKNMVTLVRSKDGGKTWGDETVIVKGYNETSIAFINNNIMIAAARLDEKFGSISVLFSRDKGVTWSEPVKVTRKSEHPADVTLLQSGKLLLTFGRRVKPTGCGALISEDGGVTWNYDREILLAGDGGEKGGSFDLGYPSTVQLDNGNIVTVLYYACGSEMSQDFLKGWGDISCQAIHYREEDIL